MAGDENGDRLGNDASSDVNPGVYGDVTGTMKMVFFAVLPMLYSSVEMVTN